MQQVIVDFGHRDLLGLGVSLRIYGYGLMLVLGFACGIWLARWRARRFGASRQAVATLGLLALLGGVLGARAAYVIENWSERFASAPFAEIFNITSGGLIYHGGVALAVALILAYLGARRLSIRRYLDIITPSLMLGLAFGRMGCLLNGCCYGGRCREDFALGMRFPYASPPLLKLDRKTNLFGGAGICPVFNDQRGLQGMDPETLPHWLWLREPDGAVSYALDPEGHKPKPVLKSPSDLADLTDRRAQVALSLRSLPVQPAQVYGICNALLLAGILICFSRLRWREGQVFAMMLVLYAPTRIVLESIRGDNPHDLLRLQLTHNQWTSLGMLAAGVALMLWLQRLPAWRGRLAAETTRKSRPRKHRKGRQ